MPGMTVLDRTRLGRWSMKQQGAEVLASLVESATTVSSSALTAVRALPSRSRGPTTMPEHYTASSAAEVEELALRTRVTGAGRVWLQERKVPIGCMPDESVVPAQLGSVPTLSFIAEIPAQADSDGDDSASDTGSNAGQARWAEELDAAEWSGEWQNYETTNTE